MKKFTGAGLALLLGTTAAYAGGMDRSGQGVGVLFETGTYSEFSFGKVTPSVSGTGLNGTGTAPADSGNVSPDYTQVGLAFKTDVNDQISLAFIMDSPFGADVDYSTAGYLISGTSAHVETRAITVLGQYHINENVSVYAGPRIVTAKGEYTRAFDGTPVYNSTYESDTDVGYVLGAAYEIPAIALRAALTYSSQTEFALDGSGFSVLGAMTTTLDAVMPQSVNLDFQTGVAADTLAFVNIRWADWSEAHLTDRNVLATFAPQLLGGNTDQGVLEDFNNTDVYTYTVGVGRKFSDQFSGLLAVSYEQSTGEEASNLSPTDGYISYQIGGAYTMGNGMKLSGGIRYVDLGDADTDFASFTGNSATAIGLKLAYNY